jgi:hypothetical protein
MFVLAGIFLTVALVVPPYILITQHDADIDNLVSQAPNLADETQLPGILADLDAQSQFVTAIALAIEAVSVILFAVCLWLALRSSL